MLDALAQAKQNPEVATLQDAIFKQVDAELLNLRNVTCALARHRNTLAPISKIPIDILLLIFRVFVEDEEWNPKTSTLRISRVCSRWRSVMLAHPSFWTVIDQNWRDVVHILLERSGASPLEVSWVGQEGQYELLELRQTLESLHRIQSLFLYLSPEHPADSDFETCLVGEPAPQLQVLTLWHSASQGSSTRQLGKQYRKLNELPCATSHKLRELSLRSVVLPWAEIPSSWPSLTKLDISSLPRDSRFTVSLLLDVISQFPLLQILALTRATTDFGEAPASASKIDLPNLSELMIVMAEDTSFVFELSKHLIVPTDGSVLFTFNTILTGTPSTPALAHTMLEIFPPALRSATADFVIFHEEKQPGESTYSLNLFAGRKIRHSEGIEWKATVGIDDLDEATCHCLPFIFLRMLDVSHVQELIIGVSMTIDELTEALSTCPEVRRVRIKKAPTPRTALATVLRERAPASPSEDSNEADKGRMPVPLLRILQVPVDKIPEEAKGELLDVLKARKASGHGLQRLDLQSKNSASDEVAKAYWSEAADLVT